jgi:hypothetical protein
MNDLSIWVTAIASVFSAGAAYAMWRVSRNTLNLQASVEDAKKPSVQLWLNPNKDETTGHLTIVNIGGTTMPIRSLRILGNNGQAVSFSVDVRKEGVRVIDQRTAMIEALASTTHQKFDLLLEPNIVYRTKFAIDTTQPKIEIMYYDNSFEFIQLDTSKLGPYTITGQGRKYQWL